MKKIFFIIFIFLIACGEQKVEVVEPHYRTGTEALQVVFQKNAPPEEIIEKSSFIIGIELYNKGATNVGMEEEDIGYITIAGYGKDFTVEGKTTESIKKLEGKSSIYPRGTIPSFYTFKVKNNEKPTSSRGVFSAVLCYPYKTVAETDICINGYGNDYLRIRNDACDVEKYKSQSFSGQGAPIVITNIKEEIRPKGSESFDVILKFTVENKGNGIPVNKNSYAKKCDNQELKREEINYIKISKVSFGKYNLGQQIQTQLEPILPTQEESQKEVVEIIGEEWVNLRSSPNFEPQTRDNIITSVKQGSQFELIREGVFESGNKYYVVKFERIENGVESFTEAYVYGNYATKKTITVTQTTSPQEPLASEESFEENAIYCTPGPAFKLKDEKQQILCKVENLKISEGSYITPLIIELEYGYIDTFSTSVKVKQVG
ncbi:MAG: hypothetical protein QW331_01890 [Candidatus Woesearchaeota archaeon]